MAESSPQASLPESSQYHHFIPRFLLRNFAVFKNPGKVVPKTSKKAKNRAPRPQKLTILDLKCGEFKQGDVSQTFGIVDMYRDFEKVGTDQHKLEKELSVLESAASEILARVTRTYDAGKKEVQLLRKDKDTLRRFLFIMMYRNSGFAKRFEKAREDYDANDRVDMLAYMDERGFQSPRDVWFANIRAFLEIKLDEDWLNALEDLSQRAYPEDARWFFTHIQAFFIAFCTPEKADDEFLLTQNVYGIYEGPTTVGPWTDYHRFAPVSPKIMIVIRSVLLPCAGVDQDAAANQMLQSMKSMYLDPNRAGSWLENMPVSKAGNNYSRVVNGKVEPLPTKISRDKHVFYFPFFTLDSEYVQKINMICLENAVDTMAIGYKSPESLRTALDFYLTDKTPGFKLLCRTRPDDTNYSHMRIQADGRMSNPKGDTLSPYLQVLHKFAKQLGSTVELEYNKVDDLGSKLFSTLGDEKRVRYEKLGGTSAFILHDFDQASRIFQLIVKVDTLIKNYNPGIKSTVRQNRDNLIATLPSRRVWLAIKHLRHLEQDDDSTHNMSHESEKRKEDAIVDASLVFKSGSLSQVIYQVFYIDHFLSQQPYFGFVKAFTFDEEGAKHTRQEIEIVFNKPGSIRNCGILAVENAAQLLATQPRPGREAMRQKVFYRVLSDEQLLELWMRQGVEKRFDALLNDKLGREEMQALKDVFFQHLYPSEFGGRMRE